MGMNPARNTTVDSNFEDGTDDSDGDEKSLFPKIEQDHKVKLSWWHQNTSVSGNIDLNNIPVLGKSPSIETDIIDLETELQKRQSVSSSTDSASDDIRSSVLHRILDNESFDEHPTNKKSYFNTLYTKYDNSKPKENLNVTDFEQYNRMLHREEIIEKRISKLAKLKGKKIAYNTTQSNILPVLDETELNYMFAQADDPKEWTEIEQPKKSHHNLVKRFTRPFHRQTQHKQQQNEMIFRDNSSTYSSIPIDDEIRLDDLPIDNQPFKKFQNFSELDSSEIDMVVSQQEKVDYAFHRIDQYSDFDPKESNQRGSSAILRFFNKINPVRIARIQRANRYQIQRKLKVRHLHQIALGGTLGVGLLLSSGKAFTIAGPFGCLLGFTITGAVVVSTMLSFCEIVTLIPLCGGVSGIASRFVDDAFGFALGVLYWFTYAISLATEITASAIMLSFYKSLDIPGPKTAGWLTLFFVFTLSLNLFDIRVYGEFEFYSTIIKLLILLSLMIYMVILNTGGSGPLHEKIGFKYWDSRKSDLANDITFGLFRPTFDVNDVGLGSLDGIGGNLGRFLQVLIASVVASYAYVGTESVIIAGSESRNPRKAIPSATKNIYLRIVLFYIIAIFLVGLNVYSGDPRLLRYFASSKVNKVTIEEQDRIVSILSGGHCNSYMFHWAGFSNGNQSPWVMAIQNAGVCSFAAAVNGFLLYFALTSASSQLYTSSRTLYFMSIQNKAPKIFSLCTKRGVPYTSVLFTMAFGLLSFLSVQNNTALVFERLVSLCATSGLLVWSCMCLSYIRFYYALKMRPDIISRDDTDYPYSAPFQPYLAYLAMTVSLILMFAAGFVVFLKGQWSTAFFFSSYGSLMLFSICYIGYKLLRGSKLHRLDQIDLDSGRREIDRVIWEDERNYSSNLREILRKGINLLF